MGKAAVKHRSCVCISVKDKNSFSTKRNDIKKFVHYSHFICLFPFCIFSLRVYFIFMTRVGRFFSVCAEEEEAISLLLMASVENLYNLGQMIDGVDKSLGGALLLFECTFFALLCLFLQNSGIERSKMHFKRSVSTGCLINSLQ